MARDFNGSTQYGQVALNLSAYSTLSVAFWIYVDSLPGAGDYDIYLEHTANGGGTNGGFAVYSGGTEGFNLYHFGNVGGSNATYTALATGAWTHIVAVFDYTLATNEVNYYLNGALQTANTRPVNSNNTGTFANSTFNVAARNAASLHADCKIAELAIYASDIGAAGAAMLADGFSPAMVGKPFRYWKLFGRVSPEIGEQGSPITLTNSPAQYEHPRIQYPSKPQVIVPTVTAAAGLDIPIAMYHYVHHLGTMA